MGAALVTGVSRRAGIGFAIARRLIDRGDRVVVHSWAPHDAGQPWGADDLDAVLAALGSPPHPAGDLAGHVAGHVAADLADPDAPAALVAAACEAAGPLSTLVVNHARSALGRLEDVTADELDRCLAVNARAAVLLVQAFAARYEPAAGPGSVVLFTSGQHRGPMAGEIPYALSKGAVQQVTATLADAVADRGITVNCVNPGPTDTGWADPGLAGQVAAAMPRGRWNTPDDAAAVVAWLTGPDARSVTGATVDAEGGFRR
ncbi:3-oxoacyl-[acyl-carrier protein] reductase [Geodermatophilus obscurus]|uniref:3-oxoacyl-[acyl-carrier protein] reductase n=1 Tax=Geodermatophilus obscurus TaxID=1861 RepID=A0A1I5CSB7_9ACTN|nr:SDR family oxidoreductase [Geodermatophilus obscurus]SFN89880.1 3-oxoacyl-[acyl-carrier protein] reductase [Geodermatophilus obscurus]